MPKKPVKAEQTDATIVELPCTSLVLTQVTPGLPILGNFDALRTYVHSRVAVYIGRVVGDDEIPQAKRERADINGLVKDIEARRIELKRTWMSEYLAFEAIVKDILLPARETSAAIDEQIKAYEVRAKIAKRAELVKHYEDFAGALVAAVPFERIEDPKWVNASVNFMTACDEIEKRVMLIAREEAALTDLNLAYPADAKSEYFATLSMSDAIARSKTLEERAEAQRIVEEQKQAHIAAQVAADAAREAADAALRAAEEAARGEAATAIPVAVAEAVPAPTTPPETPDTVTVAEVPAESVEWTFRVTCTRLQLGGIIAAIKALGFTGMVSR